ncbi:OsmC family protein [Daejeonella oryzae]|uniref:OsmC family protein n=1 Tax=Daejeonella oryzae TaxID=1122943 RepID=UPI00047BDAC7|nr:OsmC family protein [Daejeonella oryzae]
MATIQTTYLGELRTEATHVLSGNKVITDAPLDNKGKGEAFSPSDLLTSALGSCMLTIMGIAAQEHNINMDGTTCSITKIMASDPRRVGEIQITFNLPQGDYSEKDKLILKRSAENCPVAKSVHPDLIQNLVFNFGGNE